MKILIVANDLYNGGIQTSLLNLLNTMAKEKQYEIDLFLFSSKTNQINAVPKNVNIIKGNYFLELSATPLNTVLKSKNIIAIFVRLLLMVIVRVIKSEKYFRLLFKKNQIPQSYDYAVAYFNDIPMTYFNKGACQYVIEFANAKKKVGWIHTDIEKANLDISYLKKQYDCFDYVINVSKHCKEVYDRQIPEHINKSFVIYNFFDSERILKKSNETIHIKVNDNINFITVARIDNISKRIDKIVHIVKKLLEEKISDFCWFIVGDGPDFRDIKELILQYGLEKNLILLGNKDNPFPYIKACDLFVLTSDYEGYPMVVGESLCLKTPVLVTNYDSAKEQVKNQVTGWIVDKEEEAIFEQIKKIILDKSMVEKLKKNLEKEELSNNQAFNQFVKVFGDINAKE